jgi:hypothetical protein
MAEQMISLQELALEIGQAWAKALKVYANVTDVLAERLKTEWIDLLNELKAVRTNIKVKKTNKK